MEDRPADEPGFRWATASYMAALGIVATLVVITHILIAAMVGSQADTARVVNIAGRQRMLSQRMAMLAQELAEPAGARDSAAQEAEFARDLAVMARSHDALSYGSAIMHIRGQKTAAEAAIYRDGPYRLDARVRAFLDMSRRYLATAPAARARSPALAAILRAAHGPILDALNAAVVQYQADSEATVGRLRRMLWLTLVVTLLTLAVEALLIFRPLFRRLKIAQAALLEAAMTDPLTGCMNRRSLMEASTREVHYSRREALPMAVLMIDIDRFKSINDTWGHAAGDLAIIILAQTLVNSLRGSDLVGRIGGEEFALVLPDTSVEGAWVLAEKLRAQVAATPVQTPSVCFRMTVSIGVTSIRDEDAGIAAILDRADQALYAAKEAGRNRVHAYEAEPFPA